MLALADDSRTRGGAPRGRGQVSDLRQMQLVVAGAVLRGDAARAS